VVTQRFAFDEFSRDIVKAIGLADFMDGQDVGVIERRRGFGFLDEAGLRSASLAKSSGRIFNATRVDRVSSAR
jgi:hypothetical protein